MDKKGLRGASIEAGVVGKDVDVWAIAHRFVVMTIFVKGNGNT